MVGVAGLLLLLLKKELVCHLGIVLHEHGVVCLDLGRQRRGLRRRLRRRGLLRLRLRLREGWNKVCVWREEGGAVGVRWRHLNCGDGRRTGGVHRAIGHLR